MYMFNYVFCNEVMFSFFSVLTGSSFCLFYYSDPQVCQAVSWQVEMLTIGLISPFVKDITTVISYYESNHPLSFLNINWITVILVADTEISYNIWAAVELPVYLPLAPVVFISLPSVTYRQVGLSCPHFFIPFVYLLGYIGFLLAILALIKKLLRFFILFVCLKGWFFKHWTQIAMLAAHWYPVFRYNLLDRRQALVIGQY